MELSSKLAAWRRVMSLTRLVGQDPHLYEGAGYGNVSARIGPPSAALGRRSFLITATQTSGKPAIDLRDFAVVERYDFRRNWVRSHGQQEPSSESMTHGAIYDLGPHIRCVLHAHSPELWRQARALRIPITDPGVDVRHSGDGARGATSVSRERGGRASDPRHGRTRRRHSRFRPVTRGDRSGTGHGAWLEPSSLSKPPPESRHPSRRVFVTLETIKRIPDDS